MDLGKINLDSMYELNKVMRLSFDKINFLFPTDMLQVLNQTDKKITIHLFPYDFRGPKAKNLLGLKKWSYHQIYLAIKSNKVYCCVGHGDTSAGREHHSQMLEAYSKKTKLRQETPTAIIIHFRGKPIAHYFYEKFAYVNHDVGMNWAHEFQKELRKRKVPYTQQRSLRFLCGKQITLTTTKEEIIVFKSESEDIQSRKFNERFIKKDKKKAKK
jgi:hypothetical protein